ncbi:MAG: hypothetical protein IT340_16415 [Chloroflexi bacterium]|nr:hypothetical protein [Chloroflexota bacterium]
MQRWLSGWLARVVVAMTLALLAPPPVLAHILFRDGEQGDMLEDVAINFAVPVLVLLVGAVAGMVLAKWLGRTNRAMAEDDAADEADSGEPGVALRDS